MVVNYQIQRTTWTDVPGQANSSSFAHDLDSQKHPIVGFHLEGPCPTCQDATIGVCPANNIGAPLALNASLKAASFTVGAAGAAVSVVAGGLALSQTRRRTGKSTTVCLMTCRCAVNHPAPAPPGKEDATGETTEAGTAASPGYGCGSSWLVKVTYSLFSKEIERIEPVPEAEAFKYWRAADGIAAAAPNSLSTIQAIAGRWQTALTAILGLLSVTALIGGRDALQKLDANAQQYIGIAAVVSVVTAVLAIMLFAYASAGAPTVRPLNDPSDLVNADLRPLRAAWWATVTFYAAFGAAVISVIAIGVAVRYLWYGDSAPAPTKVELVVSDGAGGSTTVCGTATIGDTGSVTIKPGLDGASASTIPASLVQQLGSC